MISKSAASTKHDIAHTSSSVPGYILQSCSSVRPCSDVEWKTCLVDYHVRAVNLDFECSARVRVPPKHDSVDARSQEESTDT